MSSQIFETEVASLKTNQFRQVDVLKSIRVSTMARLYIVL